MILQYSVIIFLTERRSAIGTIFSNRNSEREFPSREASFIPLSRRISSASIHFASVLKKLASFSGLPATGNATIVRVHVAQAWSSLLETTCSRRYSKLSSSVVVAASSRIALFRDYRSLTIHFFHPSPPSFQKCCILNNNIAKAIIKRMNKRESHSSFGRMKTRLKFLIRKVGKSAGTRVGFVKDKIW